MRRSPHPISFPSIPERHARAVRQEKLHVSRFGRTGGRLELLSCPWQRKSRLIVYSVQALITSRSVVLRRSRPTAYFAHINLILMIGSMQIVCGDTYNRMLKSSRCSSNSMNYVSFHFLI